MIYLASPFSDTNPRVQHHRADVVRTITGKLLQQGWVVFSPIAYGYQFFLAGFMSGDALAWKELDEQMIDACDELWVLQLPGWEESKGVAAEIALAEKLDKSISYFSENEAHALVQHGKPGRRNVSEADS